MAQQPGLMNTAPSPIPGSYGNPTGVDLGIGTAKMPVGTPSMPAPFGPLGVGTPGALPSSPLGPTPGAMPTPGGADGFPANTGGLPSSGGVTDPALASLSSGAGVNASTLKQLQNDYGKGVGQQIYDMLSKGMFNPQVAQALIAAMQPQISRGLNSVQSSFGAEGARFSSAAGIGIGDYESQAVLGENQVLANMYQQDQQMQLSLLENILPTVNKEQDNSQSSGWLGDLLGSLEIAGGAIAAPFTGGASLGLVAAGANTIAGANSSGGGGGGNPMPNMAISPMGLPGANATTPGFNPNSDPNFLLGIQNQQLSGSAASTVGGPSNAAPDDLSTLLGLSF